MKIQNLIEPLSDTIKNTSENLTKTLTETFDKNNKVLENLNTKLLELKNDGDVIASYLLSLLSKTTNPENPSPYKVSKILAQIELMICLYTTQYHLLYTTIR